MNYDGKAYVENQKLARNIFNFYEDFAFIFNPTVFYSEIIDNFYKDSYTTDVLDNYHRILGDLSIKSSGIKNSFISTILTNWNEYSGDKLVINDRVQSDFAEVIANWSEYQSDKLIINERVQSDFARIIDLLSDKYQVIDTDVANPPAIDITFKLSSVLVRSLAYRYLANTVKPLVPKRTTKFQVFKVNVSNLHDQSKNIVSQQPKGVQVYDRRTIPTFRSFSAFSVPVKEKVSNASKPSPFYTEIGPYTTYVYDLNASLSSVSKLGSFTVNVLQTNDVNNVVAELEKVEDIYITLQKGRFFQLQIEVEEITRITGLPSDLEFNGKYVKGTLFNAGEYNFTVYFGESGIFKYHIIVPNLERLY